MTPNTLLDPGGQPQLSDHSTLSTDEIAPFASSVTYQFNNDGRLRVTRNGGTGTVSSMQWWSKGAVSSIGDNYDVRCSRIISGPAFTSQAAAVGTYITMDADRAWTYEKNTIGGGQITAEFQVVETGETDVLAQCILTFAIENGLL